MSEYDKPLKQEALDLDTSMSVSAAKESALKNLDIAEKFIKKVSSKATEAQKRFIEERIASARREIIEAAKGLDPRYDNPYSLPTAKDLGRDKTEESERKEKPGTFKTIHFIRKEMPTIGSAETDRFDLSIPADTINRIHNIEERVKREVESVVRGTDQSQEVVKTIYVENEADQTLRNQIMHLMVENTDLQAEITRLNGELDYQKAISVELKEQINGHVLTIRTNDAEIERLVKILYGASATVLYAPVAARAPVIRLPPGTPYLPPVRDLGRNAGEIMVTVAGGMPFKLGSLPHAPFNADPSPDGLFNKMAYEIKNRDDQIVALNDRIDNATLDGKAVNGVAAPPDGGVPAFIGAPAGLPIGLAPRVTRLRAMVDELSLMIDKPEVLAATALVRSQEIKDYDANIATEVDYNADVAKFNKYKDNLMLIVDWDKHYKSQTRFDWWVYQEEKLLRELLSIVSDRGTGSIPSGSSKAAGKPARAARKAAKIILAGQDSVQESPWATLKAAGVKWVADANIDEMKLPLDAPINHPIIQSMVKALTDKLTAEGIAIPAAPAVFPDPIPPAGASLLSGARSVAPAVYPQPLSPEPRTVVGGVIQPLPAVADPLVSPLNPLIAAALKGDLATGNPKHPKTGADYVAAISTLKSQGRPPVLTQELGGFRAQLAARTAERDQLRNDLAAMTVLRDQLNDTLYGVGGTAAAVTGGVQMMLNNATAEIARLTAEKAAIQSAVTAALANARIAAGGVSLSNDITRIGQAAADALAEVSRLTADNTLLTQQLAAATAQLKTTEANLQTVQARLAALIAAMNAQGVGVDDTKGDALDFTRHDSGVAAATAMKFPMRVPKPKSPVAPAASAASAAPASSNPDAAKQRELNKLRIVADLLMKKQYEENIMTDPSINADIMSADLAAAMAPDEEKALEIQINARKEQIKKLQQSFPNQSVIADITPDKIETLVSQKAQLIDQRVKSASVKPVLKGSEKRFLTANKILTARDSELRNIARARKSIAKSADPKKAEELLDNSISEIDKDDIIPAAFIEAFIVFVDNGMTGTAPNIQDFMPSSGAPAGAGVTGGGYFDGGDDDPYPVDYRGRRIKADGGDDSDNMDVMLTAGVGGAVGSIMWLGWGGLVIFLLLLFIFYLSSNIYSNVCNKDEDDESKMRRYHRELHRRK